MRRHSGAGLIIRRTPGTGCAACASKRVCVFLREPKGKRMLLFPSSEALDLVASLLLFPSRCPALLVVESPSAPSYHHTLQITTPLLAPNKQKLPLRPQRRAPLVFGQLTASRSQPKPQKFSHRRPVTEPPPPLLPQPPSTLQNLPRSPPQPLLPVLRLLQPMLPRRIRQPWQPRREQSTWTKFGVHSASCRT